jgi:hypothetical protein
LTQEEGCEKTSFAKLACEFLASAMLNKLRRRLVSAEDLRSVHNGRTAFEWLEHYLVSYDRRGRSVVAQAIITEVKYYFVSRFRNSFHAVN